MGSGAAVPRRLAGGAFASLVGQLVVTAAATVTSVAIARILGPSGNGAVALVVNLLGIGTLVFSLGLRSGLVFEVSAGRWDTRDALRAMTLAALGFGLAGAAATVGLFLISRDSVFSGLSATTAIAAALALPFALATFLIAGIALAREQYERYLTFQIVAPIAMLVLAIGLAVPFGITGATLGVAFSTVVGAAWTLVVARRDATEHARSLAGRFRAALRFGLQTWGANVLQFMNYRFDLFVLNSYAATSVVGVYSVAVSLTAVGWLLPNALQTVLFPRAARLEAAVARNELSADEADETAAKAMRQTVALVPPTTVALVGLLAVAVPVLYGGEFRDAIWWGLILVPGVAAISLGKVMIAVTSGRGYPRYQLWIGLISTPLTLAMYLVAIPRHGAWGAAVATTVSYLLTTAAAAVFFRRVTALPLARLLPTRAEVREMQETVAAIVRRGREIRR